MVLLPGALIAAVTAIACSGDDSASGAAATTGKGGAASGGSKAGAGTAGAGASRGGGGGNTSTSAGAAGSASGSGGGSTSGGGAGSTAATPCKTDADCSGPSTNRCEGRRVCSVSPGGSFCVVTGGAVDPDDHNLCTLDACDPKTGDVTHELVKTNDDDPCTIDTCDPLVGIAHTPKGGDCDGCKTATDCNDDNPCTEDVCGANGKCASTNRAATEICRDEDECVGPSLCDGNGVCKPGAPKNLADDDLCTSDRCVAGKIVHDPPAPNPDLCAETTCDKKTGITTTRPRADDNTKCTDDTCDPKTGTITHTPVSLLSDGDPCTLDACDPITGAISHTTMIGCTGCIEPKDCDDQSECTVDTCSAGICYHDKLAAGKPCSNGLTCDGLESCDESGQCLKGTPPAVDDQDPCTVDTCVEPEGVQRTAVDVDDKDPCTKDGCTKEGGIFHQPIVGCSTCSRDEDCGSVSPAQCKRAKCEGGVCKRGPAPEGTPCSLSDRVCAKCSAEGTCDIYDGSLDLCEGKCGPVALACGVADCKGCPPSFVCDKSTNACVKSGPD